MRKIFLLLFFIIFLSFLIFSYPDLSLAARKCTEDIDCPAGQACVNEECVTSRGLEIVYPDIPGVPTPKYVSTGLPVYINYIFRTSIWIIGIIIFGALIYSGVNYLTSFGNPTKLSDAKKGILSAFLGGIILLSAYLIFNTINPQLVILEPAKVEVTEPKIPAGVYLCNYNYDTIETDLKTYLEGDREERIEMAKKIKEKMGTLESKAKCMKVNTSSLLREIEIRKNSNAYTVFIVPEEKYNPQDPTKPLWEYEYGIVFHENNKYGGKCKIFPEPPEGIENFEIYHQVKDFHASLDFDVKSVTLFKKITEAIPETANGVTLYEGLQYNEIGKEEEKATSTSKGYQNLTSIDLEEILSFYPLVFAQEKDPKLAMKAFRPVGAEAKYVPENRLKEAATKEDRDAGQCKEEKKPCGLYYNTRSIEFDPSGSYIAVLIGDSGKKCEVRVKDDSNLTDNPIGRCGKCSWVGRNILGGDCYPCLEEMYVIEGTKL
jgi:hypothetical protein